MDHADYWKECISDAADECGLSMTEDQTACLARAAELGHEYFGMAFYSPPPGERIASIEQEWKERLLALQKDYDRYVSNSETAVKKALGLYKDSQVTIGKYGEVLVHGGRTERIQ